MNDEATLIKVAGDSAPRLVAGAIAGMIREGKPVALQSIGASAVNQAIKSIAVARSYLQEDGLDLYCVPSFTMLAIEGEERTALRIEVMPRPLEE
ncbi:MAG: stage V sporulation protein S [Anaerolineae bacterium]|nr:stage V sporulation protein S [Anaerolineae bacterium]